MIPTNTPLMLASEYFRITNATTTPTAQQVANTQWGLLVASNFLTRESGLRRFDEWYEIRPFNCLDERIGGALLNPFTLQLDTDLRILISAKNGNQTNIDLNNIIQIPLGIDVGGIKTIHQIRIKQFSGVFWFSAQFDPYQAIQIEGRWGYGGQWLDVGTNLKAVVSPSDTTIQVTDPTKLENTMVIKIVNSSVVPSQIEYMYVDSDTTNPIKVGRGFNGSTPISFLGNEEIYFWQADIGIRRLVGRLTQFYFEQIKSPLVNQIVIGNMAFPVSMNGLPVDIYKEMRDLVYNKADGGNAV